MDLVVLSEVRWGYFRTRKQFLLSRFPERWRVFFAQPPAFGARDPWTPRREGNVTTFTVPFLKPGTTSGLYNRLADQPWGRAAIERLAERYLRRQLQRLGVEARPVVLASNIYAVRAMERLERRMLFYDFNDSPFQFAGVPRWAKDYWRRTLAEVDALFVVSEHYRRQLVAETAQPVIAIGNGVELDHFATARPEPPDLASAPRPRIGYLGLLSHFLDFETLEALRVARRGGTLVLIGPKTQATAAPLAELARREGVMLLGERPYEQVPAYLQSLDVGVIPFRAQDPFVQAINPNKVYQYLASGLPVVTTPVLDLQPQTPHLQFASRPEDMTAAVGQALDQGRDSGACRAMARPYDWSALAERMVGEIEQRLTAA
ncbi:MAG TPA: glycosyltransferase [Candidatus Limnocylindria bacterium]|nr:glycosyltransferase [Candidatus Limnocylindria bacterium]